jgi:spermidine synthase
MAQAPRRDRALLAAFFLSGFAALGYELVWTRALALALGSEILGVLGVLAGFFGGMALGAFALHDRVRRAINPGHLFARLEIAAAVFAAVSPWILVRLGQFLPRVLGPMAGDNDSPGALVATVLVAGVVLLPGSFCLGATLPALVEARRRAFPTEVDGRGLGRLYGANTIGATFGVLVTVHVLAPGVGLGLGALVLATIGLLAAGLALRWCAHVDDRPASRSSGPAPAARPPIDASRDPDPDVAREPHILLWLMFGTGLVGVGLEVVGVSVLSQLLENTIYTFADTLAVYLLGTAIGAAVYARYAERLVAGRPATIAAAMLIALALTTIASAAAMQQAPAILARLSPQGASFAMHLVAEAVIAALVFGPSTLLMGALFAHLAGLLAPGGVGRAYALNTLGSALAPLVFGVWAISSLGYTNGLAAVVYAYLVLFGAFTWFRRFKPVWQIGPILAVVAATAGPFSPQALVLVQPGEPWTTLDVRETPLGLVIVSERDQNGSKLRRLQVGRHFRMGGAMAFGERRMGHLPLLLHPTAREALFLGVGTGATLGAVTSSGLTRVEAVELVPAVLEELHHFEAINGKVADDPRVHLHAADARRYVAATTSAYDLVVADLFHPARDGAGNLYAREHFENVRVHLRENGMFAQWLPLYQLDEVTLRLIVRTFLDVYGEAHAFLGVYNVQTPAIVLVGRDPARCSGPLRIDLSLLAQRLRDPVYGELLMNDPRDIFGAYLLDTRGLAAFAGEGPLNTDMHPRVATGAPRSAYESDLERGGRNLADLLAARVALPEELVHDPDSARLSAFRADAERFSTALDLYLRAEAARVQAHAGNDEGSPTAPPMSAVEAYLQAYEAAPEFAPSRGMLYLSASWGREYADTIFPRMQAATPGEPRVYQAWMEHLRRTGDEARLGEVQAMMESAMESAVKSAPGSG